MEEQIKKKVIYAPRRQYKSVPRSPPPPQPRQEIDFRKPSQLVQMVKAEQFSRLKSFYYDIGVHKTDAEINRSIEQFSAPESGGYDRMWYLLEGKYGIRAASPQQPLPLQRYGSNKNTDEHEVKLIINPADVNASKHEYSDYDRDNHIVILDDDQPGVSIVPNAQIRPLRTYSF